MSQLNQSCRGVAKLTAEDCQPDATNFFSKLHRYGSTCSTPEVSPRLTSDRHFLLREHCSIPDMIQILARCMLNASPPFRVANRLRQADSLWLCGLGPVPQLPRRACPGVFIKRLGLSGLRLPLHKPAVPSAAAKALSRSYGRTSCI